MNNKKTQETANFQLSNDLTSQHEVLLKVIDVVTSQLADLQADKRDLTRRLEQVEKKNVALTEEGDKCRKELETAEAENIRLTRLADQRAREIRDIRDQELASSHRVLQEIGDLRQAALTAVSEFDSAQNSLLQTLRSQRAWRAMLAIRKAYTLWTRRAFPHRLSAFAAPLDFLCGRQTALDPYDIPFPNAWDFLPDSISQDTSIFPAAPNIDHSADKYDIVVLPIFDFEFRFQRPQQIAAAFARSGHRVFWISPSRFEQNAEPATNTVPLRHRILEVRLPGPPINIYADSLTGKQVERFAKAFGELYRLHHITEAVVIVQFPYWRQIGLTLRNQFGNRLAYDCMDDWRNWTTKPHISAFALAEERRLASEADLTVTTSAALQKQLEEDSGRAVLRIRNAADFEFFQNAPNAALLGSTRRPLIGYYGAIAEWVDLQLIAELARMRPQYSFVLIGEVHEVDVAVLRRLSNVHFLGEQNYRMIPSYLASFDVCLLPFVLSKLTRAVDPVKIYEYLSQGKPIVSTPLPEVCDYADLVYLAKGATEFAAQIDKALQEDNPERRESRISFAKANNWSERVACLDKAMRGAFPLVSILVVSYKSCEFLNPFLASIRRNTAYPNYELIVADNASDDGSLELIRNYAAQIPRLRLFALEENRGFAAANNFAAKKADGKFLVFLNPDTVVTPGWLGRLILPLCADPTIGMTAPVTNFSGNETRVETSYRTLLEMEEFARERSEREFGKLLEIQMAPFLCAAVTRDSWERIGALDEQFGLGMFEDDDFSKRIRQAGYRIVAVEDCFVHHFGNGSFSKLPSDQALDVFNRNREYFEKKWNIAWTPHKMRRGVGELKDAGRLSPARFMETQPAKNVQRGAARLIRLHPERMPVGGRANQQPDGSSAIVVECEGATPDTLVQFGQTILYTVYGTPRRLSATLPEDFSRRPGVVRISLVTGSEESNALIFRVGL
jgi:GT2 family glycosyltransferase/glycosyltransferase involved in cell wall biosynthesis